jgi:hypothetical protein
MVYAIADPTGGVTSRSKVATRSIVSFSFPAPAAKKTATTTIENTKGIFTRKQNHTEGSLPRSQPDEVVTIFHKIV